MTTRLALALICAAAMLGSATADTPEPLLVETQNCDE